MKPQPVAEAHLLDAEVALHERQLLSQRDLVPGAQRQRAPEKVAQALAHASCALGIAADERVDRVQAVEQEVRVQLGTQRAQLGFARADLRLQHAPLGFVRGLEREEQVMADGAQQVERDAGREHDREVAIHVGARQPGVEPAVERERPERAERGADRRGLERGAELDRDRPPRSGARDRVATTHPPRREHDEAGDDLERHRERERRDPWPRPEQLEDPRQRHAEQRRNGDHEQQPRGPRQQRVHAVSSPAAAAAARPRARS